MCTCLFTRRRRIFLGKRCIFILGVHGSLLGVPFSSPSLTTKAEASFFFSLCLAGLIICRASNLDGFRFASKKRIFNFLEQIETFVLPLCQLFCIVLSSIFVSVMSSSFHARAAALILLFFFPHLCCLYRVHACHLFSVGLHVSLCVVIPTSVWDFIGFVRLIS